MSARRRSVTLTRIASAGVTPLALAAYAAAPAVAHGSMTDPVSRVAACYAEGPEAPKSAACKAAVASSGAQAFYDWNAVNIANAAGNHQALIPNGQLCSAGNDKYQGLDLPRADWPASPMTAGAHTFRYKGTAPHKGSFELYVTKDGYDPTKPLKWSDLESAPFAKATDPGMQNGDYVFSGTVPNKSGRHLIYSIWQRSDSPEAFYTCSDVVFGKDNGGGGGGSKPSAKPSTAASASASASAKPGTGPDAGSKPSDEPSAPTDQQIAAGADKSTVEHNGHGDNDPKTNGSTDAASVPVPSQAPGGRNLAETGGNGATPAIAIAGAGALAVGAAVLFGLARRRATTASRHGR